MTTNLGPSFVATGLGLANKLPNSPADEQSASASFINVGLDAGHEHHIRYLYATSVSFGYSLAGTSGQSKHARTFFPQHMSQDNVVIEGVCASEYEFDRLTQFLELSQRRAVAAPVDSGIGTRPVRFKLYPITYSNPLRDTTGTLDTEAVMVDGYVEQVEAGHERFQVGRRWAVQLKVTQDHIHDQLSQPLQQLLMKDYLAGFGKFVTAPPSKAATTPTEPSEDTAPAIPAPFSNSVGAGGGFRAVVDGNTFTDDFFTQAAIDGSAR